MPAWCSMSGLISDANVQNPMTAKRPAYLSYLLRLWQAGHDNELLWRASLQSPDSSERQGFSSIESLFDYLQAQTETRGPASSDKDG